MRVKASRTLQNQTVYSSPTKAIFTNPSNVISLLT